VDHCLSFRLLVFVLYALLQFTASNYPFDVFKFVLQIKLIYINIHMFYFFDEKISEITQNSCMYFWFGLVRFMVFNATCSNISVISWRSVLLVEETGVPGENHRPVASHWQTLSHNVFFNENIISDITQNSLYVFL